MQNAQKLQAILGKLGCKIITILAEKEMYPLEVARQLGVSWTKSLLLYKKTSTIYLQTSYSVQHFSFIWTWACGDLFINPCTGQLCYGYYDYSTGAAGMPFAWTHTNNLSFDGYTNPDASSYCYIGFENSSKPLKEEIPATGYSHSWFVYYFYDRALGWGSGSTHHTIQNSLNYASMQVFGGVPFHQCTLYTGYWDNYSQPGQSFYCRMRVYGNSNLYLPY
ncbi:MAG: hypothetical protein QXU99_02955 [Candidatus Bathyarchaeia archaeon]